MEKNQTSTRTRDVRLWLLMLLLSKSVELDLFRIVSFVHLRRSSYGRAAVKDSLFMSSTRGSVFGAGSFFVLLLLLLLSLLIFYFPNCLAEAEPQRLSSRASSPASAQTTERKEGRARHQRPNTTQPASRA